MWRGAWWKCCVVAVRQSLQRSALRAASGGLFMLLRCEGARPICFPRAWARLLPSAVRVRIKSRSTSARPPSTASIKRPALVPVSAFGSAKDRNGAWASTIRLTMPKGCAPAGRSSSPSSHRWGQLAEHAVKLPLVGLRTLLAVDGPAAASCGAELFELAVEVFPWC